MNADLNRAVIDSITKYIGLLKSIQIGVFSALQALLLAITVYFFASLFKRMKKDMLSSHLMIAMLPKHLLPKQDQVRIRDFLVA